MKITTNFWTDEVHSFDKLLYINGKTQKIVFQADMNDVFATFLFFKNLSKFVKSEAVRKTLFSDEYYQFAVMYKNEITPIVWFNVIIDENIVISHDSAFQTALIKRNDISIPFGRFPSYHYYRNENARLPMYREFNIKYKAFKFIANQVKKSLFK